MNILVENEAKGELDFDYEEIIKQVVEKIVSTENCPYDIEVNVLLTNNEEIHETNYNFRNIDRPTDVLSFPMVDYEYGHSRRREFAFLIAHSMLHLLGYDHIKDEDRMVMEAKQEAVLESLGITRNEG